MERSQPSELTHVEMKKLLARDPTLTAKQLKALLPVLQNTSIHYIQKLCQKRLNLPFRKMAPQPLIN